MLRKRFLFLLLIAAVGIGLLWIEDYTTESTQENIEGVSLLPDYYGEGLRSRTFDVTGNLERQFNAKNSTHMPTTRLTEFEFPKIKTMTKDGEVWVIQSAFGTHFEDDKKLVLIQDVQLSPISTPDIKAAEDTMIIRTSELTLLKTPKIAKTDKPVEITSINGQINAVGMIIKLDQQRVEFLSQVKAKYVP
jgi:LPS export ABC transporter protein LptC